MLAEKSSTEMTEPHESSSDLRTLLDAARCGQASAAEQLLPLVYDELRALAASFLAQERPAHTLQPTALVHEAYIKLIASNTPAWEGRSHFFAVAAKAMRQILMNHSRDRKAAKRGGALQRVTLDEAVIRDTPGGSPRHEPSASEIDLEALDTALTDLERIDERQCRIVEMRFFGGMTVEETASVLDLSERTVQLEWRMAKARLKTALIRAGAN